MSLKLFIFIFLILNLYSQDYDRFLILTNNGDYLIDEKLNNQLNIFPQIDSLYMGSIIKPIERKGYYVWLLLKRDNYLLDSIFWLNEEKVLNILSKVNGSVYPIIHDSILKYDSLVNRALDLSLRSGRLYQPFIARINSQNPKEIKDSANILNEEYLYTQYYYKSILDNHSWDISTNNNKFVEYSILAKSKDKLLIFNWDQGTKLIYISDLKKLHFTSPSTTFIRGLAGSLVGFSVGGYIGAFIATKINKKVELFDGLVGGVMGMFSGLILGGIAGATLFPDKKSEENIELSIYNGYDKYYELDNRTYFALPTINDDSLFMEKYELTSLTTDTSTVSPIDSNEVEFARQYNEFLHYRSDPYIGLGIGLASPLSTLNFKMNFYLSQRIGILYTGLPIPIGLNFKENVSRFGIFYRLNPYTRFKDIAGIYFSDRKTSPAFKTISDLVKFNDLGVFYEVNYNWIYLNVGIQHEFYGFHDKQYDKYNNVYKLYDLNLSIQLGVLFSF